MPRPRRLPRLSTAEAIVGTVGFIAIIVFARVTMWGYALVLPLFLGVHLVTQLRMGRIRERAAALSLEITDSYLRQFDRAGELVAEIDRSADFKYQVLDIGGQSATYRVIQGDQRIDFTSEQENAEEAVRDVLGLGWPPWDRSAYTA